MALIMCDFVQINSSLLTSIYKIDKIDISTFEKFLDCIHEKKLDNWVEIGCKYIAPLLLAPTIETIKEKSIWIQKIIQGVFDPYNGVCDSVDEGIKLFYSITSSISAHFHLENLALAIVDYLEKRISAYDLDLFQSLCCPNEKSEYFPINLKNKWNIGIVNPWPDDLSGEVEAIHRIEVGAYDAGIDMTILSEWGHVLDSETQKATEQWVDPKSLDFLISTHYENHKSIDTFYYHAHWNPPEIPLNLDYYYGRCTDNYIMNDDFLVYDEKDGRMSKHLNCVLKNCERSLDGASSLTASLPAKSILEPKLDNPKMFYCGMNWEKVVNKTNRHEGLFKLLDRTKKVKFFGPEVMENWGGLRPWDGYDCYQSSIPFDGFSILKEINDCGICLVLSSDIHRRSGAATNRLYEACAAGAVIISDDNPFVQKYFKDSVLFIQYNKNNAEDTFKQIMEKYEWITEHRDEALELAKRSQNIFIEHFSVDEQLKKIIKNHAERLKSVKRDLFARSEVKKVLVTFVVNTRKTKKAYKLLLPIIKNIQRQYYRNIQLAVAADISIAENLEKHCRNKLYSIKVIGLPIFDAKMSRCMTDAEAISILQKTFTHDYFINTCAEEVWFKDHVTTLIRSLEDSNAAFAYSGRLVEDKLKYKRVDMFRKLYYSTIYNMNYPDWMPMPGQIMFDSKYENLLTENMYPFLDGMEHYALMCLLILEKEREAVFTRRMTFNYIEERCDERCSVITRPMQIRLIRDSVKHSLPDVSLQVAPVTVVNGLNAPEVMRIMSAFPIKKWIFHRFLRLLLRLIPSRGFSFIYKKLNNKYQQVEASLINHSF